jgi:ABC-type uncharacterized transport system involved in gliding motility auxiliary subunit
MDRILAGIRATFDRLTAHVAQLPRHTLAWLGLALGAVILLSVNLFAATAFRTVKADLTQQRLFTISDGTRAVLRNIDEPISIRLYFSKRLGEAAPSYARYFERVRSLLEQYRDISRGQLEFAVFDPEPFSDAEDRAVAAGLRGIRLNNEGETGYFGLTGNNSTDNDASIAFFSNDREPFLEYDVTKLIYTLANPKKRVVGLLTGLPLDGGMAPMAMMGGGRPQPPQMVMEQIREFFEVKTVNQDAKEIPAEVDVLLIAQPDKLTPEAALAVDQFVLGGGKALVFVDPVAELGRMGPMGMGPGTPTPDFIKILKAWGVDFDASKTAGDIASARRVQFGGGARPMVTEYVAWLTLDRSRIDENDVLSGGIERINLSTPGFLSKAEGAKTQVSPLLVTSNRAMQISADKFAAMPDPVGLLRGYKPEGKALMLAARVAGEASTAFPDGIAKPAADKDKDAAKGEATDPPADGKAPDAKAEPQAEAALIKPARSSGRINVIVVADTDLLSDQFWVDTREFLGQQVAIPNASNAALVVNALDNLSGSDQLIGLRARGVEERPFKLVNELRRDAEQRYREKEQLLTNKLKDVQAQLAKLESGEGGSTLLTESEKQTIEKFRSDLLATRRELREVKRALREDIDRLDGWLKFANIALVPLLIGFGGIGWAALQRRRHESSAANDRSGKDQGDAA